MKRKKYNVQVTVFSKKKKKKLHAGTNTTDADPPENRKSKEMCCVPRPPLNGQTGPKPIPHFSTSHSLDLIVLFGPHRSPNTAAAIEHTEFTGVVAP